MESRLDLLSPSLVNKLSQADEKDLRKVAYAVSEIGLRYLTIEDQLIESFKAIVKGMKSKSFDIDEFKKDLLEYVERLDDLQWLLHEKADLRNETMEVYLQAFKNARIVNSLYYALDDNAFIASAESIYELNAAINDLEMIIKTVDKILQNEE